MNKVILMGRLVRDVELRYGANEQAVARYTLAVDRAYKREDGENTDFINCVCFGKTAEFARKYLSKGTKVLVVGSIQVSSYTDKEENKRTATNVVVNEHHFCESKKQEAEKTDFMDVSDEDLPF